MYDFEAARKEASSIEGGWAEIEWIITDLRVAIDAAFREGNDEILRDVVFFPLSLAITALHEGNYYVFEQFLRWVGYSYLKSTELNVKEKRHDVTDLIANFLREVSELHIEPEFRYSATGEGIKRTGEFSRGMIVVFSQLLKSAFDKADLQSFELFARTLTELFEGLRRDIDEEDEELLRWRVRQDGVDAEEREGIREKLDLADRMRHAAMGIDRTRDETFFGMGAWIVQKHLAMKEGVPEVRRYYDELRIPNEIGKLTELYFGVSTQQRGDRVLGWEWWVMEEAPRREVIGINFDYYLARVYVLKALEALGSMTAAARGVVDLPLDEQLEFQAGREEGDLQKAINEIGEKRAKLGPLVTDLQIDMIPSFRDSLARAVSRQRSKEAGELIAAPLDGTKVRAFRGNVIREWRRSAVVRAIVGKHGSLSSGGEAPENLGYYGFNVMDRKDVYVANNRIHSADWGNEYGRSIASTENEIVMGVIAKAIRERTIGKGQQDAVEQIDSVIGELSKTHVPNVLVLSGGWHVAARLREAPGFRAAEAQSKPETSWVSIATCQCTRFTAAVSVGGCTCWI